MGAGLAGLPTAGSTLKSNVISGTSKFSEGGHVRTPLKPLSFIYPVALPRRPATALGMDVGLLRGDTRELNIAPERTQFRPKS